MKFLIGFEDVICDTELPADTFSYYDGFFHNIPRGAYSENSWEEIFAGFSLYQIIIASMFVADEIVVDTGSYNLQDFLFPNFNKGYGTFLSCELMIAALFFREKLSMKNDAAKFAVSLAENDENAVLLFLEDVVEYSLIIDNTLYLVEVMQEYIQRYWPLTTP